MYIKNLKIKDFRNYEVLDLEFNEKVNIIIGSNAQGKTNLMESIYISSFGRSFRTSRDTDMIRFGQDMSKVKMSFNKDRGDVDIEILLSKDHKKSIKVDGVRIKKTSQLLDNVYIVIFSPDDLKIIKDEPEKRRKFIDKELCQIKPSYYSNLSDYKKVLLERNTYLKEVNVDPDMMDIWDMQLAKYGAAIMNHRKAFIDKISDISREIHEGITNNKEILSIKYDPNIKYSDDLKEQEEIFYDILKKSFENDLRMRTTTKGPHKDDLEFFIKTGDNEINARNFGSQGQQRTAALSLKLAEIDIIKKETGEYPILLLDDVLSELDLERQEYLIKTLSFNQLFITAAEMQPKLIEQFSGATLYKVSSGKVEKQL
ncbi:MAG: DNA replication/repair protein RecF [Firmicutes bacterium]|nr:DNA replication/repair protein RecF [Bacillota bacterium]